MTNDQNNWESPWRLFVSELVGTAVLLLGGLSLVIFMFGAGSPMERVVPSVVLRQIMTGFLFGCVGATIALSPVGKEERSAYQPGRSLWHSGYSKSSIQGLPWVTWSRS